MASRLMLASGSPRRRELLLLTGLSFAVARPDIDETPHSSEPADQYVARLSREKSLAIQPATESTDGTADALIITADTTVADGADILGKPRDAAEATAMLQRLRGRRHNVHTGLTLRDTVTGTFQTSVSTTTILMRDYSDAESERYVAAGEPFDKAGAYGIQHAEFHPVACFEGCYANVMGLPLCVLCTMLSGYGVELPRPIRCDITNSDCAVQSGQFSPRSG